MTFARVIEQLGERSHGVVVCPYCNGGSRNRRTLSVDLRDGVWLYLCHRATCAAKGAVPALGADGRLLVGAPSGFVPRPLEKPLRFPVLGDAVVESVLPVIGDANALNFFCREYGLRVLADEPTTHVWVIRGFGFEAKGYLTRTANKVIKTWRELDVPFYAVMLPEARDPLMPMIVVEDCLSAAALACEGVVAVALLGTNLSREAATEIAAHANKLRLPVLVALDSDEAGQTNAMRVVDRLRNAGVADSAAWLLRKDINKLTPDERGKLMESISDMCKR